MAQISVKDQLNKLIALQQVDGQKYDYEQLIKEKPVVLEAAKTAFETTKTHLNELEGQLKQLQLSRKEQDLNLKTKEDEIAKANAQLSQLKTNKEYSAKLSEIESIKADQSILEDKILGSYDDSEAINVKIENERKVVQEEEKKFAAQKQEIEVEIQSLESKVKELDIQRQHILPDIDSKYMSRYEQILKCKSGRAVVPVEGASCGGCFMNLTPQQIESLRLADDLVECEMCSRILYLKDE